MRSEKEKGNDKEPRIVCGVQIRPRNVCLALTAGLDYNNVIKSSKLEADARRRGRKNKIKPGIKRINNY